jgi:hypothetical protein
MERVWKQAVLADFKVPTKYFLGEINENHEKHYENSKKIFHKNIM